MTVQTYRITAWFPKGYIADPYWPEVSILINVQKQSGMNRAKSDANRRKALEEYLTSKGMTLDDYRAIEKKSQEPFYRDDKTGLIIIPQNHTESFLVNTCDEARSATRPCDPQQVRSRFIMTPWTTGKEKADGVFRRYAKVTSGTGQKLSNQRGLREDDFVSQFEATGTIAFDPDFVDPATLKRGLEFGGTFVGIGAARKMGWGRFELREFKLLP